MRINEEVLHLSEELIEREKLNKSLKILYTYFKRFLIRCIDIIGALVGLIICIPLTVVVAVKNHQNKDFGPIFFVQERIGKNGKRFKMFKYRTMVVGADDILFKYLEENPNIKLLTQYANSFTDSAKGKAIAQNMIKDNADIIRYFIVLSLMFQFITPLLNIWIPTDSVFNISKFTDMFFMGFVSKYSQTSIIYYILYNKQSFLISLPSLPTTMLILYYW